MKKIVLGLMVALIAASVASSVYAHDGGDEERGEGGWRQWLSAGVHLGIGNRHEKNDDRDDEDGDEHRDEKQTKKQGGFGECGKSAREDFSASMKAAFSAFKASKKAAHDVRVAAIVSAHGDISKITSAWVEFQASFLVAWGKYSEAVTAAMKDYGIAFAKCKVVLTPSPSPTASASPTPTLSPTPTATYSLATVQTHNLSASCWVAISGKVYNLTNFIKKHQGGSAAITSLCGTDATVAFSAQHSGETKPANTLSLYLIGTLQ